MKYRLMAEYRNSVNADLYWIERKAFLIPWMFVSGTMSFDKKYVEGLFEQFASGNRKANVKERIVKEVSV